MGLELKDVAISLKGEKLLGPLNYKIEAGTCLTIMGPSGSGKSTLLEFISRGLMAPFQGTGDVYIDNQALSPLKIGERRIGILYQDDLLFPHMNIEENLAFGLPETLSKAVRQEKIQQALKDAGLEGFEKRDPATLSGGQRARISCMRMLLSAPRALLLDEPFSKLDMNLRAKFREFVFNQAQQNKLPVIMVTHDPEDANAAGGALLTL